MENRKMMVLIALAFVVSFAAAYFASGWVAAAVADHAAEQVGTQETATVMIVEC